MKKLAVVAFLAAHFFVTPVIWGQAAPLRMLCSNGVRGAILDLKADWEKAIGRPINIEYGATAGLRQKIDAGEAFDLAVLTPEATADLTKQGKIMAGTNAEIARVGIGVGIRQGAPKPDVSTPDALKQTLMKAKSITLVKVGASRAYIDKMYERLGAGDALKAKTLYADTTEHAGEAVASGKIDLSIMPLSEIPLVKGVVVAAPLPVDLQNYLRFEVSVAAKARDAAVAKKAAAYLTSPAAKPVFKAKGME
jgi:molybdate transport system substrate-binding protein